MSKSAAISRDVLDKFLAKEPLSDVVALLYSLNTRNGLQKFSAFCEQDGYALHIPANIQSNPEVLFHGSRSRQSILNPNASVGVDGQAESDSLVYATNDPNYAIFLAILDLQNGGASVNAAEQEPMLLVDLDFVNGPSRLGTGYIHVIPAAPFEEMQNKEFKTKQQVEVLFTLPVTPQDLTVPIYIQTEA